MSISVEPTPTVDIGTPLSWAAPSRRVARVLLALTAERTAQRALQEADAFARRLGAELHLVRVVPHLDWDVQGAPRDLAQATRDAQRVLAAARHTRMIADRVLLESLPAARICIRLGSLVDQVAQRASELDALISVVPPGTRHLAPVVTELARRTGCPVLIPKGRVPFRTLLAATDLEDSRTPVLEKAAELARELGADGIAFHSLTQTSDAAAPQEMLARCRQKLEHATLRLAGRFDPIVVRFPNAVQGILDQARAHDAGLIVVGARARASGALPSTAAQLVRRARRSVLIAPLAARHDALHAIATT